MQMWTEKYKPKILEEIVGQKKVLDEVLSWLASWKKGEGLLLHGPPGSGKNTIVETLSSEKQILPHSDERF